MTQVKTCYMCDDPATTIEHVPPKSFFPPEFRKNLITVPSCKTHNNQKSDDDDYIRTLISLNYENNPESQKLFNTKVMRSLQRNPRVVKDFVEKIVIQLQLMANLQWLLNMIMTDILKL